MDKRLEEATQSALAGGPQKYHDVLAERGKLFVRDRIALLVDAASFVEDGLLARNDDEVLAADGVVTGRARIEGRAVMVIANDPTVKAGSWGRVTVEKMIRALEAAYDELLPVFYLVDSAGARITDQIDLFPGRRGAGKIFYNQIRLSGRVPQICCLFGPSAAGGAYIPSFCDVVVMVEGRASMYLGSPRMAQMVVGETTTLEAMGGARMHCETSGCGDALVSSDEEAIGWAKTYFSYVPDHYRVKPNDYDPIPPSESADIASVLPEDSGAPYDMHHFIDGLVDEGSFFAIKDLFARELITGFARLDGAPVGIVASQPAHLGGVLFVDSADKAARFMWLCDAFNIPLLFLADVPGFMIGSQVEAQGIIRHGAKMLTAMAEATVPRISVIVRKAYGAGLYAFSGPGLRPEATIALPTAEIAVMGPEAAINAVYFNVIEGLDEPERTEFIEQKRAEYIEDVDLYRLAAETVVDAVIAPSDLRSELIRRYSIAQRKDRNFSGRRHGIPPV
ncbi:MAG: acyl-CoA carboxylase subunit beta [Actinomycetota bacterium]|jgi:acetyl-CoA carboxylase carboxyltransferase component|nr:acyl-CoA carboxylase subunit beta [Actinomycetota bacterium]